MPTNEPEDTTFLRLMLIENAIDFKQNLTTLQNGCLKFNIYILAPGLARQD